jgi:hypothetical protein
MTPQLSASSSTLSEPLSSLNEPPESSLIPVTTASSFIYKGVLGTSLYILCLMTLKLLFVKLSTKYASVLLKTQSCIPIPLIHLFRYLCQLKALLLLHLRILLLAYVLCLFQQWLHCKCCRKWLLHLMNQHIPSKERIVDALPETPIEQESHVPPLLPLPILPTIIVNALHPQRLPLHLAVGITTWLGTSYNNAKPV